MAAPFSDLDGNGAVTAADFTTATDKHFALLDRNGDRRLGADDLGRN